MSDFEGAFAVRIGGDSQHPARWRLTPSSLIRSTRAGERLMKAAGSYSSRLVENPFGVRWKRGSVETGTVKRGPCSRRGGKRKNAKRAAEFRAAASSSVTVAARILLDIPRVVRMRSSECRARKPRRMAPRVWVVRKGQGSRGVGRRPKSGPERAIPATS
ncbi:hypothetical protein ALC60_09328 [Trachymyrmex zeteki]|uniref:Uncharacterized protein n=1 Tax=Mycetomoellerius zeteki TaxID=64791 RepID=A0A151WUE9_9HYME|nr:hypothetical protein ALC60_09328 [Trachymyrmex zeteki]